MKHILRDGCIPKIRQHVCSLSFKDGLISQFPKGDYKPVGGKVTQLSINNQTNSDAPCALQRKVKTGYLTVDSGNPF
jgi:hypothetical protein